MTATHLDDLRVGGGSKEEWKDNGSLKSGEGKSGGDKSGGGLYKLPSRAFIPFCDSHFMPERYQEEVFSMAF